MQNEKAPTNQPPSISWQGGIDWNDFLVSRGLPGGVELVGASANPEVRLFELLASWITLRTSDGRLAYPYLRIITTDATADAPKMIGGAAHAFKRLFGHPFPNDLREAMTSGLRIVSVPMGDSSTLPTIVENALADAMVYVPALGEGLAVSENPSTLNDVSPLVWLLRALSVVADNSTGIVIIDSGDTTLSMADSQQLSSLDNLGYSINSSVSLETAKQSKLEELWMYAWINGDTDNALELSRVLRDRFGWPTPDRMIVFDALRECCRSRVSADSLHQAAFPLPIPGLANMLHRILNGSSTNFEELKLAIERVAPEWEALILLCIAEEASRRSWHFDVLLIATPTGLSPELATMAVDLLLTSIEAALLSQREHEALEDLAIAVNEVLRYVADNPESRQIRLRLGDALAPDRSGMVGISILAYLLQGLAQADRELEASNEVDIAAATSDQLMMFVERALKPHSEKAVIMGELSIPDEIMIPSADALMERLLQLISYSQKHDEDDLDVNTHELLSTVGIALAKHTSKPNLDLDILRFLGSRLPLSGKLQRSRDVAESLLITSAGNSRRARLGWLGYADIYNRGGNQIQAAIGMCCALAIDVSRTADEAIRELSTAVRILRDSHLLPVAEKVCGKLSSVVAMSTGSPMEASRAEFLHLSIRMQQIIGDQAGTSDEIIALIEDTTRHLERARSLADAMLPAAVLLGQLVNFASEKGLSLTEEALVSVSTARSLLDGRQALLFDIACGRADSTSSLLAYVKQLEHARFSSDAGYDLQTAALAARRILASPLARTDKDMVVFASEILNDLGVSLPQSAPARTARTARLPSTLDGPASKARTISKLGVDIVTLASNASRRVVVTQSHQGKIVFSQELESDIFSLDYLNSWSTRYPYEFADIPAEDGAPDGSASSGRSPIPVDADARFLASMEPMRLGLEIDCPTIFVADPLLQSIPPNLFLMNDTFVGRRVATGSSPSLTWLCSAVATTQAKFGPSAAWISDSGDSMDWRATLNVLTERVRDHLQTHSIPLSRSTTPPLSLRGAEVAIVGAHGGLADTKRYFRVITDDARTRIAPDDLTRALHGARVVVLFVCSGGRVDMHPFAHSTVGLPRQLIAGGAEAVIASPWPLDLRVPDYWLPTFLETWNNGETLMEANFRANRQVAARTGSPEFALAMTVYGNPLARRIMTGKGAD